MTEPSVRLTCKAPHMDPRKKGEPCSGPLGDDVGHWEFVTICERLPDQPDGKKRLQCPKCHRWNVWQMLALPPGAPLSPDHLLAALKPEQQQAAVALAGGIPITTAARQLGIGARTIFTWKKDPAFQAAVNAITPGLTERHTHAALEALFTAIEKDRKRGVAVNARWFLSRTVFLDAERAKAAAGGASVSVNVAQSQQQTQATVRQVWEGRSADAKSTAVARED